MAELTWTNDKRRLGELMPWPQNPRQIRKEDADRLADSLDQFGQVQTIAIDPDGEIVDGHQRQNVWAALDRYGPEYEVDVRVASRELTERERQQLSVYLHRGAVGDWDWDSLANWDVEIGELVAWGFEESDLIGLDLSSVEFPEYDESIADEVEWLECPNCGHKWPK